MIKLRHFTTGELLLFCEDENGGRYAVDFAFEEDDDDELQFSQFFL